MYASLSFWIVLFKACLDYLSKLIFSSINSFKIFNPPERNFGEECEVQT